MNGLREELQEKGFVKIPRSLFVLDDDKLTDLRKEFDDLFQGKFETGIYPDEINWRQGISKDNVTKELCNAWKASTKISETVRSPELGRLACALMGWKSSRIGQDDVLDKPPKSYACVGFHQDGAYISDNFVPREDNSLTMWIALDDSDKENGALVYAPGSHRWRSPSDEKIDVDMSSLSFHVATGNNDGKTKSENDDPGVTSIQDHLKPLHAAAIAASVDPIAALQNVETVAVAAGELLVHHQRVWHGSGPNQSLTRHRRALVAHLLNGEVRWRSDRPPSYIYGRYFINGESVPREDFFPTTFSSGDESICK